MCVEPARVCVRGCVRFCVLLTQAPAATLSDGSINVGAVFFVCRCVRASDSPRSHGPSCAASVTNGCAHLCATSFACRRIDCVSLSASCVKPRVQVRAALQSERRFIFENLYLSQFCGHLVLTLVKILNGNFATFCHAETPNLPTTSGA